MPVYKKNNDKNKMLKIELPSTPGAEFHVPSRLGYGARIRVRSSSYKVHVEPGENGEDKVFQTLDPAAAEHELLVQSLLDPRSYHNLTDDDKKLINIDRFWIETDMDEDDALYAGQYLMGQLQEDLGFEENDTSAEGNDEVEKESLPVTKGKQGSKRGQEASQSA